MSAQMIDNPNSLDQYVELMGEEGAEFVIDIIDTFLEDTPPAIETLEQSMVKNDFVTFRRAAHSIKTGCSTVGATKLAEKFLTLEKSGAAGDLSAVDQTLEFCKAEFLKLSGELLQKKQSLL